MYSRSAIIDCLSYQRLSEKAFLAISDVLRFSTKKWRSAGTRQTGGENPGGLRLKKYQKTSLEAGFLLIT